jgi:hypothetical protein
MSPNIRIIQAVLVRQDNITKGFLILSSLHTKQSDQFVIAGVSLAVGSAEPLLIVQQNKSQFERRLSESRVFYTYALGYSLKQFF